MVMILGSVGHLLIYHGLLGLALVAAVPVGMLAVIALIARSYWQRRRQAPASDSSGTEPTPSPSGSPGMGPAVAAITLMLSLSSANAKRPQSNPQRQGLHPVRHVHAEHSMRR